MRSTASRASSPATARGWRRRVRGSSSHWPRWRPPRCTTSAAGASTSRCATQRRSIVLACKLAEVRYLQDTAGVAPVILLDDVLSELDPGRRAQLLVLLAGGGHNQVFVTTAEPFSGVADFADVMYHTVRAGVVTQDAPA